MVKKCGRCRRLLEANHFHKDNTKQDGLYTICKDCRAGKTQLPTIPEGYRMCRVCDEVKPESQYYPAHEGTIRLTCIDCCEKRWSKSYRPKLGQFPSHLPQSLLSFISKNEQKALLRSNPKYKKRERLADKKYKSSAKGKQKSKEWWANNRPKRAKYNQTRKAREFGLLDDFSEDDWQEILDIFEHKCAYCQEPSPKFEQEHWIPVCKGGHYTRGNIIPACQHCNRTKKEKMPQDFCSPLDYLRILTILQGLSNE